MKYVKSHDNEDVWAICDNRQFCKIVTDKYKNNEVTAFIADVEKNYNLRRKRK